MNFKICQPGEIRYDIINYPLLTDEQKNLVWLNEIETPYSEIQPHSERIIEHVSRLVKYHVEQATEEEKEALWDIYDDMTKKYTNYERYKSESMNKFIIKQQLRQIFPDQMMILMN